MTNVCTPYSPSLRRTAPAVAIPSVRCLPIGPFTRPSRTSTGRLRPQSGPRDVIRHVHRGKTVLPHLLKTRYKFHRC